MKARLLTKILNDTKYTVNNNEDYIAVGSPLCHNLISVDKTTLKIKYALDTWHEGRKSLTKRDTEELLFIWDKLQELIDNGQIKDIIEGVDKIENPLPVYTVDDGKLIATFTDQYGWPNTTINGEMMYENTHFKISIEAIKYGIADCEAGLKLSEQRLSEVEKELAEAKERVEMYRTGIKNLKSL